MKIAIAGIGYVGLSNAIMLAQHNEVVALDISSIKVDMLNRKQSPIEDNEIEHYLKHKPLNLRATLNKQDAYEYIVLFLPITTSENSGNSSFRCAKELMITSTLRRLAQSLYNQRGHRHSSAISPRC